jgi:hypothetical protein
MNEVRALCSEVFPGATVRKHLLWRYSIAWQKPDYIPRTKNVGVPPTCQRSK